MVTLKRPISELATIAGGNRPATLTVMADEEVPAGVGEPPAMSTVADLVLMLDDAVDGGSPYFHNAKYAPPDTLLASSH